MRRVLCEVYSRVVGYLRPVGDWNKGKQQEFEDRKDYEPGGVDEAFRRSIEEADKAVQAVRNDVARQVAEATDAAIMKGRAENGERLE